MEIKIYSTPTCPNCHALKDWLKQNGKEYTEVDVAANEEERDMMIEKSGQMGVPVVEIGEELIVGFDKDKIAKIVDIEV